MSNLKQKMKSKKKDDYASGIYEARVRLAEARWEYGILEAEKK